MSQTEDRKVHIPDAIIPPYSSGGYINYTPPPRKRLWINYTLFAVTVVTTLLAGAGQEGVSWQAAMRDPSLLLKGLPFSITLIAILGAHEMGHFFMARKYGVDATLPYFIPAPSIIGTFGAVIKMRSPIKSREALIDIGAAGPIAGMLVAMPACYIGIVMSEVKLISIGVDTITYGDSLLLMGMKLLVHGPLRPGYDLSLNPVLFAGWIGMLVTMLNLLPVGQLDGGHVSYAVLGRKRALWLARLTFLGVVALAIYCSLSWVVWILMLAIVLGLRHPQIYDEGTAPLDGRQKAMAVAALIIFIITFIPAPVK
jgi:membrane-associated protease RseP (regulator of RpoE activity)